MGGLGANQVGREVSLDLPENDRIGGQPAQAVGERGLRAAAPRQNTLARKALDDNALVEEVGHPHLGICLDAFHYQVGPSKSEDLALLTKDNLL